MKITIGDVKSFCENIGLKVLSEKYTGIDNKMTFENNEGYRFYTTFHIIKSLGKSSVLFPKGNKYNLYNLKNYIKINNLKCKLLSDEYIDEKRNLEFMCECGKNYICTLNRFTNQKQYTCKICSTGALSQKELISKLNERNLKSLNSITTKIEPLLVEDIEGYKYKTKFIFIRDNCVLNKFHTDNPYTIENIKNYLKINGSKSVLLSDKYSKIKDNLVFKCGCGKIFNKRIDVLTKQLSDCCNDCGHKITRDKLKNPIEYIYDVCREAKLKPLFSEYNNKNDKLLCETIEGYKVEPMAANLINGCGYSIFEKRNPYTINNIKLWLQINNTSCKIISSTYYDNKKALVFKCKDCDSHYKCSWERMLRSKVERCTRCSKSQSSYENKVEDFLISKNISYKKEYKFEDCKHILSLPFDFAIFKNEKLIYLIECDGLQHFKPIDYFGGEEAFRLTKIRDDIKNKYCENNNINLIRIPYLDFKNEKYIEIINNNICLL